MYIEGDVCSAIRFNHYYCLSVVKEELTFRHLGLPAASMAFKKGHSFDKMVFLVFQL